MKNNYQLSTINSPLPEGWEIKKLDEACEVEYGTRVVRKRDGGTIYPVYGGGGPTFFMDSYNRKNCLVVARFAMSEQCTRFVNGKFFLNDSGLSVKPKKTKEISQDFLNWQFLHLNDFIYSLSRGAAQKNLNVPLFRKIKINYPKSIEEQKRIVFILDRAFDAIAKAKTNAEQNLKNANELFESYLQGVFENGNWETKTIKMVCDEIFAGGDAPKNNFSAEPTVKHKIPIYANAVKDRGLYGYTDFARVTKPCITIAARGSGTGHTELRNEQFLPIVRLIVCIPDTKQISTQFLKYTIDNLVIQRSGSAIPQLTVPMIKDYRIPVPSIEEQKHIIQKSDKLSAETKRLENIYQQKLIDLEDLKKSVLQKAFNGEL